MTTHRSLRTILSLTATVVLIALAGTAFALEQTQFRPQVEQFLADDALPQFELEGSMRMQDAQNCPDEGVVRVKVGQEGRRREHYVILDETSGAVVGFIAAEPTPPVPMDAMPAEGAAEVARQFAQRHLPELFADGGEVAVTVEDEISPRGGRMVHLQRTVQGVQVPTLADVGVRVYDGKVVYWRRHHVPLSAAVIEDHFEDKIKRYVIAGTGEVKATTLHEQLRKRWEIEEAFMELTRYWNIDNLGSCRHEVYLAQVYFALLAYALLRVFSDRHGDDPPDMALSPGRELVVYWQDCYAILLPSELFEIVFAHFDLWKANQQRLLEAMRYCEGRPPPQ